MLVIDPRWGLRAQRVEHVERLFGSCNDDGVAFDENIAAMGNAKMATPFGFS